MWNKEYIDRYIKNSFKRKNEITIAVFDIDFFTNINQKIGYTGGDEVLKQIAAGLKKYDDVTAGRYDSDEFIFIFIDKEKEFIEEFLKEYRRTFRKSRFVKIPPYEKVRITFSMGVAKNNKDINNPFLLLKSAQAAMLNAKKNGRNRIEFAPGGKINIIKGKGVSTTVIGKSLKGNCPNGAKAFTAPIAEPYGVGIDINGDLLFVDRSNHQIKRIHNNKIFTVAGKGKIGYIGDGKHAINAEFNKPSGVCVHKSGALFIADTGNHVIRKINKNGIIATVAGCGERGYSGDGKHAILGRLNRPGGVAVDDEGNVYTNDYGNNVIRKVSADGILTTVAGNGEFGYYGDWGEPVKAALNKPYGLCVSKNGEKLYIADYGNHAVREADLVKGTIKTLCGDGEAGYSGDGHLCYNARLNGPFWVALYENNLYIADANNHCIRRIDLSTKIIDTIAGNGRQGYIDDKTDIKRTRLNIPAGLIAKDKYLYIADYGNNAIRRVLGNW